MAFFLSVHGRVTPHHFNYLETGYTPRLEPTLITGRPLAAKEEERKKPTFAIEIMTKKLITIAPHRTVQDALALYRKNRIHHIPVLTDKVLTGMLSDRDLHKVSGKQHEKTYVSHIMEETLISAHEDTEVTDIAKVMIKEHISSLPIIDDKYHLTGIITIRDILKWLIAKNKTS